MDPNEILKKILRRYGVLNENIRAMQVIESKISRKIATYADAEDMAIRIGKALTTALRENLPDALTDGQLYRAIAEVVLEQPMKTAGRDVAQIAAAIQQELNQEAGIGMNPIIPAMNQDQIDGIITGICNADSYEAGEGTMMAQVENCLEGYVDDFVRENADFQYKAGLSPTIERKTIGKCCEWCSRLAGSYPYEEVSDRGNDVFRRHKNCHCQVLYNPGDGSKRRQDVHSREFGTEEELRERQLRYGGTQVFDYDYKKIVAKKIIRFSENNLSVDQNVNLSPSDIRKINTRITKAKELHGIAGTCNSNFVIVNDERRLAAYNPRTDTVFVSSRLAKDKDLYRIQADYTCPRDGRSTLVHELFHWKDAEEYRKSIGDILDASPGSDYTQFQQRKAGEALTEMGFSSKKMSDIRKEISRYAEEAMIDNNYEEAYTELRTKNLIEGGARR